MKKWMLFVWACVAMIMLVACSSDEAGNEADKAVETRDTVTVDEELEKAKKMFQPLGEFVIPVDNPISDDKIELGKQLYFDPRLSGNNTQSCMSCHAPGAGYGDGLATFIGFEGVEGSRNSPTILNAAYYQEYFWDGRAGSLEEQALGPIQSEVEMNQNLDELVVELKEVPQYVADFKSVFDSEITIENIAKALATFERTLIVENTAFDRFLAGDDEAISADAKEGMKLFAGKASCITCHAGPTLSDNGYHNLGIEDDEGRFAVTNNEEDKGKFRTPGLRGVGHTGPYMHDGSLTTLEEVIDYYNDGGGTHANKSELVNPLDLTEQEATYLIEFLKTLNGELPVVNTPTMY